MSKEAELKVLRAIGKNPHISQRELAKEIGVSLGKVNYCLKALIEKGWVKASNFKNSKSKAAYAYVMTPRGIKERAEMTRHFLNKKVAEYALLQVEIEQLRAEFEDTVSSNSL